MAISFAFINSFSNKKKLGLKVESAASTGSHEKYM
jgi:hypothetical protein